jgi:hypothetical protein
MEVHTCTCISLCSVMSQARHSPCTPSSGSLLRYNSSPTLISDLIGQTHFGMNSYNCPEISFTTKTSQYKYSNKMMNFFLRRSHVSAWARVILCFVPSQACHSPCTPSSGSLPRFNTPYAPYIIFPSPIPSSLPDANKVILSSNTLIQTI